MGILSIAAGIFKKMKSRTLLSVMGIAIGVTSVIVIGYIGDVGTKAVNNELDSLGIAGLSVSTNSETSVSSHLLEDELEILRSMDAITSVSPLIMDYGEFAAHTESVNNIIWGIDAGAQQVISLNLLYGKSITKSDVRKNAYTCMVDESVAQKTYARTNIVGKTLSILISGCYEEFEVVGVVETGSGILQNFIGDYIPSFVYIPYTTLQSITGKSNFSQIAVKVQDNKDMDQISEEIRRTLEQKTGLKNGYTIQNLSRQRGKLSNLLHIVTLILSVIGGISLVVAGLGVMTLMLVSVHERTREIGIKKAIGANNRAILFEFLIEALFISLCGSILGLLLGTVISFGGSQMVRMDFDISLSRYGMCLVFSAVIGSVFGAYPAYKAAKLKPVDALRYE